MDYQDLINQWFDRSESEKDFFTKYIFIYIAFIAFMSRHYEIEQQSSNLSDRKIIKSIQDDKNLKNQYKGLIKKNLDAKVYLERMVTESHNQPIPNTGRRYNNEWSGSLETIENWENIVEFWYRVRNNLFHGHKAPEFDRDKRLVKMCFESMNPLMKFFKDKNWRWEV